MGYVFEDRVRDTSTTTGTGTFTTSGVAPINYRTFASVLATGDLFPYAIVHQTAGEWESGVGACSAANQFTRTPIRSSNGNAVVNFSAGTKDVVLCPIADKATMQQWLYSFAPSIQSVVAGSVVGNDANTTEKTLFTFTLPANSLNGIGKGLHMFASGYWGTNATRAIIKLYFGSEFLTIDQPVTDGSRWFAELFVVQTATGTTRVNTTGVARAGFPVGVLGTDAAVALGSTVTCKVTGQSPSVSVANQAVAYQLIVRPLWGT